MRLKNSQVEDQLTLPNTGYIAGATLVDDLLNAELKSLVHTKPIRLLKFKTRIDSDIQTYIFIWTGCQTNDIEDKEDGNAESIHNTIYKYRHIKSLKVLPIKWIYLCS